MTLGRVAVTVEMILGGLLGLAFLYGLGATLLMPSDPPQGRSRPRNMTLANEVNLDQVAFTEDGFRFDATRSTEIMRKMIRTQERAILGQFASDAVGEALYLHVIMHDTATGIPFYVVAYRPAATAEAISQRPRDVAGRIITKHGISNKRGLITIMSEIAPEALAEVDFSQMKYLEDFAGMDITDLATLGHVVRRSDDGC